MEARLTQTDHDLMASVSRGNLASMSELYQRRHRNLFRFFFRLTGRQAAAEDLVHEVFLRMIRYRHTYQSGDGFESWMYRIARNAFADQAKKHRLETAADDHDFELFASDGPSAFDNVAKQQELALLYRALRELPDDKRELIVLSRFQGLTHEQIGQIAGCETGAAKVRVFRAMKEIARIYADLAKADRLKADRPKERTA
jgi:RNA polymerase sigma factor (sigma-70 family)